MEGVSLLATTLSFATLLLQPAGADTRAKELLAKSFQRSFGVNIVAVIEQRDPSNVGEMQLVKVDRSRSGSTRHQIIQPLRSQGVMSIDDGERSMMYLPAENMVINQESPQKAEGDVQFRVDLAAKNYTLSLAEGPIIAGRRTTVVTAKPRDRWLDERRLFLDEKTSYPLRHEVIRGKVTEIQFTTKEIQYPASMDPAIFRMRKIGGVTELRYDRPADLRDPRQAERLVGFMPIVPRNLPLGFKVQSIQVNETEELASVAVRITDGLVRATVYQWRQSEEDDKVASMDNRSTGTKRGIRVMLVSELGANVRKKLLDAFIAFAREADRNGWNDIIVSRTQPGQQ